MNIETAIITALEYEKRVREMYVEAISTTGSPVARRIYSLLAEEENDHVFFLETNLNLWKNEGRLSLKLLEEADPSFDLIEKDMIRLDGVVSADAARSEMEALNKALQAEVETSAFYSRLCEELPVEGQQFFQRFLEIELGHVALLEAEISAAANDGYWFGNREFDLENQ